MSKFQFHYRTSLPLSHVKKNRVLVMKFRPPKAPDSLGTFTPQLCFAQDNKRKYALLRARSSRAFKQRNNQQQARNKRAPSEQPARAHRETTPNNDGKQQGT